MPRSARRSLPRRTRRAFVQTLGASIVALGAASALGTRPLHATVLAPSLATPAISQVSGTLTLVDAFEPKSYADGDVFVIREGIGEGLLKINFQSQFEGALATDWGMDDANTWRFTLRPNVTFHNGVALDAGAVVASLQRLAGARNAAAAFRGAVVTAVDSSTVTIRTTSPTPYLPSILADSKAVIYEPSASFGSDGSFITPIGTGPFRLVDFRPGDRRVLAAHDAYWGGTPGVSEVHYLVVPQGQTRANMIRSGEADIARVINPSDLATLQRLPWVQVLTLPLPRVRLLYLNTQGARTGDVRVRRALASAVDRDTIVQTVLEHQGVSQAALFNGRYPWGNPNLTGIPFDPDAAQALLTEAGYGPSNPLSLTITTYPARPELPLLAQVLQQQFANVGIEADIRVVEGTVMEGAGLRGENDISLVARNPLFLFDPQGAFESDFASTGSYNLSRYANLDAEIAAAATVQATDDRYARYRQMEQQIIEQDVAAIVMTSYLEVDAIQANISGYQPHPTDYLAVTELVRKG
ncbi:MAG: ABC transporter substrate-binding protein [Chloroflexi bacterium]|nr:ABC transporter substrate-binding protein [Chloroflexota bacterium]